MNEREGEEVGEGNGAEGFQDDVVDKDSADRFEVDKIVV